MPELNPGKAESIPDQPGKLKICRHDARREFSGRIEQQDDMGVNSYASRPDFGQLESPDCYVYTNHFKIDLVPSTEDVDGHFLYEYSVNIDSNHSSAKKKTLMNAFFKTCRMLHKARDVCVTDYVSKIVSWVDLSLYHEDEDSPVAEAPEDMAICEVPDYDRRYHKSNEPLKLTLHYHRKINVEELQEYAKGNQPDCSDAHLAMTAMNFFLSKHILSQKANCQVGSNKFFIKRGFETFRKENKKDEGLDDAPGRPMHRGYSYRVRPAMGQLLLSVNPANSVFYDACYVSDCLQYGYPVKDLIGVRVYLCFRRNSRNSDAEREMEETAAFNTVQARVKTIYGISDLEAGQQEAYQIGSKTVTVWDHMEKNYLECVENDDEKTEGSTNSWCINTNPKD